jgi:hypothetical protein
MNAHPIPPSADLVSLIELSKRWDIEDCCARRKAKRLAKSRASLRGWDTQRENFKRIDAFSKGEN